MVTQSQKDPRGLSVSNNPESLSIHHSPVLSLPPGPHAPFNEGTDIFLVSSNLGQSKKMPCKSVGDPCMSLPGSVKGGSVRHIPRWRQVLLLLGKG